MFVWVSSQEELKKIQWWHNSVTLTSPGDEINTPNTRSLSNYFCSKIIMRPFRFMTSLLVFMFDFAPKYIGFPQLIRKLQHNFCQGSGPIAEIYLFVENKILPSLSNILKWVKNQREFSKILFILQFHISVLFREKSKWKLLRLKTLKCSIYCSW